MSTAHQAFAETLRGSYAAVVEKAWRDPAYRSRLKEDPAAALAEAGAPVPDGLTVEVVEDTDQIVHLVLPAMAEDEMSDAALGKVAGGVRPPPPPRGPADRQGSPPGYKNPS